MKSCIKALLILFLLSSWSVQVLGAIWYLASIQRQHHCWNIQCKNERNRTPACTSQFLNCSAKDNPARHAWLTTTNLLTNCDAQNDENFQFGMFAEAFTNHVAEASFIDKYFYCLWWGLRNLRYS
jgi:cyclic nucleotide gated channel